MSYLPKELPSVIQLNSRMLVTFCWHELFGNGQVVLDGYSLRFTSAVLLRYTGGLSYECRTIGETVNENDRYYYGPDFSALVNSALTPAMFAADWAAFFSARAHLVPTLPVLDTVRNELRSWIFRGECHKNPMTIIFEDWESFEKAHQILQVPITNILHRIGTHIKSDEFYGAVYPLKSVVYSRKHEHCSIPMGINRIPGLKLVLVETWRTDTEEQEIVND